MDALLDRLAALEAAAGEKLDACGAELDACAAQLRADQAALIKRRDQLVSGKAQPSAEELAGFVPPPASPGGAAGAKGGAVPFFWLNVLANCDGLELSARDLRALAHCTGLRALQPPGGGPATIEMSFAKNPFFTNSLLRRCLGDAEAGVHEAATDIEWRDAAHNLTVVAKRGGGSKAKAGKASRAKGASGGGSEEGELLRLKPCASFFRFFLPDASSSGSSSRAGGGKGRSKAARLHDPAALSDDEAGLQPEEDQPEGPRSAKAEADEATMALLLERVLPKAAALYMAGPLQGLSDSEDGSDDGGFAVVHGAVSSSHADLPGPVQAVLHALQANQAQLDALAAASQQQGFAISQKTAAIRQQLAEQRRALLVPPSAAAAALPRFWLRVLRSVDTAALAISARDAAVLACLADVRFNLQGSSKQAGDGSRQLHGTLELEFLPNRFLTGSLVLAKAYTLEVAPGAEPFLLSSKVASAPSWASGDADPTLRRAGGLGAKARPAASLFQLFKPGHGKWLFNLTGNERDAQDEANALETELLLELFGRLLLDTANTYQQLAKQGWPEDDSAQGDEDAWRSPDAAGGDASSGGGSSDDEGEGEAAHRAAARRSKGKHGSGHRVNTKAAVLIALVLLMLLGQLWVLLDGWLGGSARRV